MRADHFRASASGQALVETLLIGVLLSLVAALSLLWARLQALDHSAAAASHALAGACASAREVCADDSRSDALAAALIRRQLGQRDREVLSGDTLDLQRAGATEHAFFRGLDGRSLVQWAQLSGATRDAQRFDAGLAIAARASGPRALLSGEALLDEAGPARFGLDASAGLGITRLRLPVQAVWPGRAGQAVGDMLSLQLHGRSAMLADAWNAPAVTGDSAGSVESRVQRGRSLDPARESLLSASYQLSRASLAAASAIGLEALGRSFTQGRVDPAVVPSDRVGP